jgi:hypothetical protein
MTELERIIRPIVEGQIRGFLMEHPNIVKAVDWYNTKDRDPAKTFVGSLAKRIVRDLTCGSSAARLAAALLGKGTETQPKIDRGMCACGDGGADGQLPVRPVAAS